MKELALHILDITQNSIKAEATLVTLKIIESKAENTLTIIIEDNGIGIPADKLRTITDPFVTSRTTRKVGLGLSLFKAAAVACEGFLEITSEVGVGTKVVVLFQRDHIDCAPLGNMADTIVCMVMSFGVADLIYEHHYDDRSFIFDGKELKEALGVISLNEIDILNWIREFVENGLKEITEEK